MARIEMHTQIIAHRGASRECAENTIAAFERALELGADAIELDVHASADGRILVHHDPVVGAGQLKIAESSANAVRAAGVAAGFEIPLLDEVIELASGRAVLYVEVKGASMEPLVARLLSPHVDWCAVHSFDHRVAAAIRELEPQIPTGILSSSYVLDPAGALLAAGARDYWQHGDLIDPALVEAIHSARGRVICWTVNEAAAMQRLRRMGVDGICTDVPGEARAALAS